jgi:hypothetical protein
VDSLKKHARIAGLLYLLMTLTGPFVLLYVPGKLFVPGDATVTVNNIREHQSLFQAYIVVGLISELAFIATVLALYRLLKDVGRELAAIMVILVLIDAPAGFISIGNQIATLAFVRGAEFLNAFDAPQRNALAALFINIDKYGVFASELFWGLWLLPLAMLVYRSGFIPRFLGVWLFINGLAYVIISMIGILMPPYLGIVNKITLPVLFGEMAFMLWLLIVGARKRASGEMVKS